MSNWVTISGSRRRCWPSQICFLQFASAKKKKAFCFLISGSRRTFSQPVAPNFDKPLMENLDGYIAGRKKKFAYLFSKGNIFFDIYIQIMMSVWPFSSLILTRSAFS